MTVTPGRPPRAWSRTRVGPRHRTATRRHAAEVPRPAEGAAPRNDLDRVNQAAWRKKQIVASFDPVEPIAGTDQWLDPGECAAIMAVASRVRGQPVLDLGVGTGRTIPFLRLLSDDYVGIDYTETMVQIARRRFPGLDLRLADARDLSEFASASFSLVVFSFNGIDAVDHDGRCRVLAEIARVLRPGGVLVFSTHNKSGPCFQARPWHPAGPPQREQWGWSRRLERFVVGVLSNPMHLPRSIRNWRRLRRLASDEGAWGVGPVEAHDFDLLIHFTTLAGERAELAAFGLELAEAFDPEHGRSLTIDREHPHARYLHLVAVRR